MATTEDQLTQPWKALWPHNASDDAKHDPLMFTNIYTARRGGKGAQPVTVVTADGTNVFRLDKVESFVESLDKSRSKAM